MRKLKRRYWMFSSFLMAMLMVVWTILSNAPASSASTCSEPHAGSVVQNPPEINNFTRNRPVKLTTIGEPKKAVNAKTCYNSDVGLAPTIRINPGEIGRILPLQLTNGFPAQTSSQKQLEPSPSITPQLGDSQPEDLQRCAGNMMTPYATSLHFHGFNVSPRCGQDEVVKTAIAPGQTFNYQLQVPGKEPPGLYWYHPHIHMQSEDQVVSGSTGALILNGIGKFNPKAAKLPERVFVLRDMRKRTFSKSNTQEPVKDISINSVPIRYQGNGKYDPPAVIEMSPAQEQFWRVANTAADSYFNLQLVYDRAPQSLELVSLDGVPINSDPDLPKTPTQVDSILLPPAARAEFIVKAPAATVKAAKLMALQVDTPDTTPDRVLAVIQTKQAPIDRSFTSVESKTELTQVSGDRFFGLSNANPIQQRQFAFTKNEQKGEFYITEAGKPRQVYDMNAKEPNVSVQEGTTEDWTIQNQDNEIHAFHIHQIHFLVLDSPNAQEKNTLRDTINVPVGKSVKLRMDFRGIGSSIAGTFVYHCHILEHEDGGMMGSIQVMPKAG